MGLFGSKSQLKQVLLTGPEGAGKTTLLYQMILRKKEWRATPTIGFNYEEIQSERGDRAGIWDVGGSASTQMVISSIYKNVYFSGLLYVMNIDDPEHINIARKEFAGNKTTFFSDDSQYKQIDQFLALASRNQYLFKELANQSKIYVFKY
ncbi:adp-ribosylation factor-like protein 14 [Stylonychia lemnae]|uniref:Adp-ribosylation factor-like protein 14 n=1 Tax=Stylonychia lemnae TaxID=5949 RepID=A0A078AIQ9_STYLE|nr:adp-ribosylation factor-like protein 14 [Stylonychia lemnae]|eukprot:CDW81367.1 adp-ribosylation factor-like protein 14 [Stylonychia lemnae]